MKRMLLFVAFFLLTSMTMSSAAELTYKDLVNKLVDLESLAVLPASGEKCAQCSSYDRASKYDEVSGKYIRWDANGDGHGIIREEDGKQVIAEMEGPGCIWRIWSANAAGGHVKIYLDGVSEPVVDLPFSGYFDGKNIPFTYSALVHNTSRGMNSYVPIPFQKSCKIVADPGWGNYYHFTYSIFPKDTILPTFRRDLSVEDSEALAKVNSILSRGLGTDPVKRKTVATLTPVVYAGAGRTALVADLVGPQAITCLRVKLKKSDYTEEELRSVVLKIYWDGEKEPSVWAPLGDFFGTAPDLNEYKSLPMGVTGDDAYSYWYMPFASEARIELTNEGRSTFKAPFFISTSPLDRKIEELGRFHAKWHRDALLIADKDRWPDWLMLKTEGRGRFCGVALEVWNPKGGWWGEGDENFFVDGEKFPSTFGTGSEDYFGYAWCDPKLFYNAFHNQPRNDGNNIGHVSVNRWHIADNVPFQSSFEADIEKYFPNARPTLYAVTVYWYLAPGGKDPYSSLPVKDRLDWYINPKPVK